MSVGLILDEIPKDCSVCPLVHTIRGEASVAFCYGIDDSKPNKSNNGLGLGLVEINHSYDDGDPEVHGEKPDWCPLQEVEPVTHGRWKYHSHDAYICTECGNEAKVDERMDTPGEYCPWCGAKMEMEGEG